MSTHALAQDVERQALPERDRRVEAESPRRRRRPEALLHVVGSRNLVRVLHTVVAERRKRELHHLADRAALPDEAITVEVRSARQRRCALDRSPHVVPPPNADARELTERVDHRSVRRQTTTDVPREVVRRDHDRVDVELVALVGDLTHVTELVAHEAGRRQLSDVDQRVGGGLVVVGVLERDFVVQRRALETELVLERALGTEIRFSEVIRCNGGLPVVTSN